MKDTQANQSRHVCHDQALSEDTRGIYWESWCPWWHEGYYSDRVYWKIYNRCKEEITTASSTGPGLGPNFWPDG